MQEGAGHASISGYVEVVFDNSDGRFPVRGLLDELGIHTQQRIHTTTSGYRPILQTAARLVKLHLVQLQDIATFSPDKLHPWLTPASCLLSQHNHAWCVVQQQSLMCCSVRVFAAAAGPR
jgi:hypothetical protein